MKKIIALIFCTLLSFNAMAIEYSSIISIDVTDKNAASAKEKAWAHANRVALNNVMKKISQNVSLDYLSDEEILNIVKQTEVLSEKNSQTRYIGKLKVVFNQQILDSFLKEKNIQKVDIYTKRVLLIPLYKDSFSQPFLLWEPENKIKEAFEKKPARSIAQIDIIKPNAKNYFIAQPQKISQKDIKTLNEVAKENLVEDIFIIASQNHGSQGVYTELTHYKNGIITTEVITTKGDINSDEVFNKTASDTIHYINSKIKETNANMAQEQSSINVFYNFHSLQDWVQAKNTLQKISYIKDISPIAMQSGRVEFNISYIGDYNQLLYSLRSKGYIIKQELEYYILERI